MTRRRRALADLDQDIRDHLERETQENIERAHTDQAGAAAFIHPIVVDPDDAADPEVRQLLDHMASAA